MHELSITRNIVGVVSEQAEGRQVIRVQLKIGKLSAILPEAIRFCFDVCIENTPVQGAELEIIEIPGRLRCENCGAEFDSETLFGECQCGSKQLDCVAGKELLITELEMA